MQFADIIGQQEVKQQLAELVQHNRLSHALLFLGKEGSGSLPLALAFAQYIVCEKVNGKNTATHAEPSLFGDPEPQTSNPEPQTDSCGVCPACLKAQQPTVSSPEYEIPFATTPKLFGKWVVLMMIILHTWKKLICVGD